jgi:hypothetical protein
MWDHWFETFPYEFWKVSLDAAIRSATGAGLIAQRPMIDVNARASRSAKETRRQVIPTALKIDRCQIPAVMAGEGQPSTSFLTADVQTWTAWSSRAVTIRSWP